MWYELDRRPVYKTDPQPEWWHPQIRWTKGPNRGSAGRENNCRTNFLRMCAYYGTTVLKKPVTFDDANQFFRVSNLLMLLFLPIYVFILFPMQKQGYHALCTSVCLKVIGQTERSKIEVKVIGQGRRSNRKVKNWGEGQRSSLSVAEQLAVLGANQLYVQLYIRLYLIFNLTYLINSFYQGGRPSRIFWWGRGTRGTGTKWSRRAWSCYRYRYTDTYFIYCRFFKIAIHYTYSTWEHLT